MMCLVGRRAGTSGEQTREQLLAAAVRVFAAKGYEGSRVSEIAAEAGLSTGAIYSQYGSKTELLCAAVRSKGPKAVAGLVDSGSSGSVVGVLRFLGTRLGVARPGRRGATSRAILVESLAASRREPEVADVLRSSLREREQRFAALVRKGQEAGEIGTDVSADGVARLCLLLLLGSVVTRTVDLPPPPVDEWEAVIKSLVRNLEPDLLTGLGTDLEPMVVA
jgi:AcrR family transcriptional regulator